MEYKNANANATVYACLTGQCAGSSAWPPPVEWENHRQKRLGNLRNSIALLTDFWRTRNNANQFADAAHLGNWEGCRSTGCRTSGEFGPRPGASNASRRTASSQIPIVEPDSQSGRAGCETAKRMNMVNGYSRAEAVTRVPKNSLVYCLYVIPV
jgi:hypothetical protein